MYQDKTQLLKQQVLLQARSWVGTKFHHQGRSKKTQTQDGAVDCIGLIVGVAKELGLKNRNNELISKYDVTDYSKLGIGNRLINTLEEHFDLVKDIQVSDVLLFSIMGQPQHVGIVAEKDNRFTLIHSYQGNNQVVEHDLSDKWKNRIIGIYRWQF
jgi:hypothetical protein